MKVYLLMDGRAYGSVDDASVLTVSDTLEEARRDRAEGVYGDGCAIVEAEDLGEEYGHLRVLWEEVER